MIDVGYNPDVSTREKFKRLRQRQRQAHYEARQRAGVALYPAARSRSTLWSPWDGCGRVLRLTASMSVRRWPQPSVTWLRACALNFLRRVRLNSPADVLSSVPEPN